MTVSCRVHPTVYERPLRLFTALEPARYPHAFEPGGYNHGSFELRCRDCGAAVYVHRVDDDTFHEEALDWAARTACPMQVLAALTPADGASAHLSGRPDARRLARWAVRLVCQSGSLAQVAAALASLSPGLRATRTAGDRYRVVRAVERASAHARAWHAAELTRTAAVLVTDAPRIIEALLAHPNAVAREVGLWLVARAAEAPDSSAGAPAVLAP